MKESCSPPVECFSESLVELELLDFDDFVAKSEKNDNEFLSSYIGLEDPTFAINFGQNI